MGPEFIFEDRLRIAQNRLHERRVDIAAADDPAVKLSEIEARLNKLRSPFRSAEAFWIEEIIDPRDTRALLCDFVTTAAPLRQVGPTLHGMRP